MDFGFDFGFKIGRFCLLCSTLLLNKFIIWCGTKFLKHCQLHTLLVNTLDKYIGIFNRKDHVAHRFRLTRISQWLSSKPHPCNIHEQIVQLHVTLYILDVPPISTLIDLTTMRWSQVTGHNSMTDMTIHTVWWNECHHSLRLLVMLHHSICTTWNRAALLRSQGQTHQKGHSVVQHLCAMWPCQEVESVEVLEDRISDYFRILMKVWSLIIIVRRRWTIGGDGSWFMKPRGGQG